MVQFNTQCNCDTCKATRMEELKFLRLLLNSHRGGISPTPVNIAVSMEDVLEQLMETKRELASNKAVVNDLYGHHVTLKERQKELEERLVDEHPHTTEVFFKVPKTPERVTVKSKPSELDLMIAQAMDDVPVKEDTKELKVVFHATPPPVYQKAKGFKDTIIHLLDKRIPSHDDLGSLFLVAVYGVDGNIVSKKLALKRLRELELGDDLTSILKVMVENDILSNETLHWIIGEEQLSSLR